MRLADLIIYLEIVIPLKFLLMRKVGNWFRVMKAWVRNELYHREFIKIMIFARELRKGHALVWHKTSTFNLFFHFFLLCFVQGVRVHTIGGGTIGEKG